MKKTIYITIALVITLSAAAVATLYFLRPGPVWNGFNRGHIYRLKKLDSLELKFNHWYISWLADSHIYLGNYKARLNLFSCTYGLRDTIYQRLSFAEESQLRLEQLKGKVLQQIEPNGDSFSADGFVTYAHGTDKMLFTYYYRNSFVCLDTGMKVLYAARMIDTNSVAKVEVTEYKEGNAWIRTMSKPAVAVNKRGCVAGNWFYNHSALAADNESYQDFDAHEVLDVYGLDNGRYSHSIYLPKYPGRKLTDFALRGDLLVALYEKVLVTYRLGKEVPQAK